MSETVKKHEVQSSLRLGSHQLTMLPFFFGRLDALEVWEKNDGWRRNAVKPQMAWDIYGVFPKIRKNLLKWDDLGKPTTFGNTHYMGL